MEVTMGAEFTPDAVSVCMVEVMAIVTSIEVAAMATVTTDIMAITPYYYGGNPGAAIGLGILGGALGGIP